MRLIPTPPAAEEPAPCPLGCDMVPLRHETLPDFWIVECITCRLRGPAGRTAAESTSLWNRIASLAKPEREVVVGMSESEASEVVDRKSYAEAGLRLLLSSALTPTEEKP